jgi:hypothetical protein
MSIGLLGATGTLDIDGMTFDLVPIGGEPTQNLAVNPDFELGDPDPFGWITDNARRGFPGFRSESALELSRSGARILTGLSQPVDGLGALELTVAARGKGLRGSGGASMSVFFVDGDGRPLPGAEGGRVLVWGGTFDWREDRAIVPVPPGAARAVVQFDKADGLGTLWLDRLSVTASPNPEAGEWTPFHVADETDDWLHVTPSTGIEKGSALDFSFLLDGPAGKHGGVGVKNRRLGFARGGRARFHGVQLLPPTAFQDAARADALADRLARSGVNLVRLGELDSPLGPDRSLLDDTRDDTQAFDPGGLARLDHLIAALKARGIYVAIELLGTRRFRPDDGVADPGGLPPGGGPAAIFDPKIIRLTDATAKALLDHVNPETGVALKHEPALAWVTLAGEISMFNLADDPAALPADYQKPYRDLAAKSTAGVGRRFWQNLDAARWKSQAEMLRKDGLKAPVAGASHWRRDRELSEALAGPGLDLIDDRIYWAGPSWIAPRWRSMLWSADGGILAEAAHKRRPDRPYVVGQFCDLTHGVWASPYEAADQVLAVASAADDDWDGLVRRGIFVYPEPWGAAAPGTAGGEDIFQIPEATNAQPQVFALWPHTASLLLRGQESGGKERDRTRGRTRSDVIGRTNTRSRRHRVPGWDSDRGRLVVETPYTQGVVGWPGEETVALETLTFDIENPYAVVLASSVGPEPIATARRLLVTAVARITPTGFLWVDGWKRQTADPGRPPLLQEPVKGSVAWKRKGHVRAYALDNNGARTGEVRLIKGDDGVTLPLDGTRPVLHWELVAE